MKTAFKYLFVALMLLGLAAIPATTLAAGGTGTGDALLPVGQAQTVAAHSAQWYYFDRSGGKGETTAALDDNGASGIRLAIYTPDEIAAWQNGDALKAIGTGGPLVGHDLGWVGSVTQVGRYYAVVYNDSDTAVTLSLRVTGDQVTTSVSPAVTPTPLVNPFAVATPLGGALPGKLVFMDASGGNIYTVNGDGTGLKKVTTGLDPAWNSSGTQIAFARQGSNGGIFTINADGSNERLLYNTGDPRAPQWSPDNSLI
ncbi:MAG: TolB family protein, partial [Rudaea sp.]